MKKLECQATDLRRTNTSRADRIPLSFQQEWALKYWMQKDVPFIGCMGARLQGPFDAHVFQSSVSIIVERHKSLRTGFIEADGTLVQEVCDRAGCTVRFEKITNSGNACAEARAKGLIRSFYLEPMNISDPPLLDIRVFELDTDKRLFAFKIQHLVTDGVSQTLFFRELWSLYGDLICGRGNSLPDVHLQYPDYATQQRARHPKWLVEHRGYWEKKLAGTSPVKAPVEPGPRASKSGYPATQEIVLDRALSSRLFELARQERTTPAMIMLALYAAVMRFWCDQTEFVIPFAVSGRSRSEQARAMGFFAHYLPLRIAVDGNESLLELLKRVVGEFSQAQQHLDAGWVTNDHPRFFQGTSLNWLPCDLLPSTPPEWAGRRDCPTIEPFPVPYDPPESFRMPCETYCLLVNTTEGIRGMMQYRTDLLKSTSVRSFCESLRCLSESASQHARAPLASIYKEIA